MSAWVVHHDSTLEQLVVNVDVGGGVREAQFVLQVHDFRLEGLELGFHY